MSRERALEIAVRVEAIRVELLAIENEYLAVRPARPFVTSLLWRAVDALADLRWLL